MGRPSKLNDLCVKRICDALKSGVSRAAAAHGARISYATLKNWLSDGRDGVEPYVAFLAAVLEAEARAETEMVHKLFEAARNGSVGAMCFWLERRRHEDWGKRDTVQHEHADASPAEGTDYATVCSIKAALESKRTG